ncbi:MAG: hypothetical protein JO081_15995 [Alphaproteobacteria bacterium]|nr:hypothetical protein [Alphaproteobacteria bacterium]
MLRRQHIRRAVKWGLLVALVLAALYILQRLAFLIYIAYLLYQRDFMDASAKNGRGDVVSAETDFFGAPEHRSKTVIRLKRAGYWFSTTLAETRSWEVLVGLNWRDDNTLDLQLEFGCGAQTAEPVTAVGPIHIVYHWGDPGQVPKIGYETFRRRDLPREPCR